MTKMLRPLHTMSALVVVASVTSGALVASAALSGLNRPASVTIAARREDASGLVQSSVETRDMLATVDLVNAERAALGLAPLAWNDKVAAAAAAHSADMARINVMQHAGSDGSNAGNRLDRAGFRWSSWGETIGAGFNSPGPLVAAWMASPGHREQLTGNYTWVGISMVRSANGVAYWTLVVATGS
jgi:uncharacterized protein YkwD